MIAFNRSKYSANDESAHQECLQLARIEECIEPDSFFGYLRAFKLSENLIDTFGKPKIGDGGCFTQKDADKFSCLKSKIPWDLKKPYTKFETGIISIIQEIELLLKENKLTSMTRYNEKISESDCLIDNYIKQSRLIDPDFRLKFHNNLNGIKDLFNSGSLISYSLISDELIKDLERIRVENDEKYANIYLTALKKYEVSKNFLIKYKDYVKPKDIKTLQDQYILIDKLFQSCKYDLIYKAVEMINRLDSKINDIVEAKKNNICENLKLQVERLRPSIWLEDWEVLNKNVTQMIKDAEETRNLLNFNLDRYHIDRKIYEKKDAAMKLITSLKSKKINNYNSVMTKAERFLNEASYQNDFNEFQKQLNPNIGSNLANIISGKAENAGEGKKVKGFFNSIFKKKK